MDLLPSVGWADVARRRDVDQLAAGTQREIAQLESRMTAAFDARLEALERRLTTKIAESQKQTLFAVIGAMLATVIAVSGLAFAAAGLT